MQRFHSSSDDEIVSFKRPWIIDSDVIDLTESGNTLSMLTIGQLG